MAKIFILGVTCQNVHSVKKADNVIYIPDIFVPHLTDNRPYQIWRGSRFSAKSWTKAIQLLYKCMYAEYFRGIFIRKTQKSARDSQFQLFTDLIKRYKFFKDAFTIEKTSMRITCKYNGHYLQGGSFEKSEAIFSIPEITDAWVDEPIGHQGSISRTAFEDIAGTLRNSHGIVPQFHFTFNPIGKNNFIYEDFFDAEKKKYSYSEVNDVIANYGSNPFCPKDRIEFLDGMKIKNPRRYLVDGLGQWGNPSNDSPYITAYDDNIHYTDQHFEFEQTDTWLTFDFNNSPTTCSVYQVKEDGPLGPGVYGMRSYKVNGGTRRLCEVIKRDDELMAVDQLFWNVTGDSNGKNYTSTGGDVTDYQIIQEEFRLNFSQIVGVHSSNKSLEYSRRLNNEFLANVPFWMDKRMEDLRNDFMIAHEDDHGKLFKDRKSGYGMDFLDHHRYFVHALCKNGLDDINYLARKFRA